jgi:hypothetical protein
MKIKRIKTAGYRGPGTNMQFMPSGWYDVGNHLDIPGRIVPDDLARYLVETGQMAGVEAEPDGEPEETKQLPDKDAIAQVTVTCDRCGKEVSGMEGANATAGFYRVTEGIWHKYANEGEEVLCDSCMQSDPRYLADYPSPTGSVSASISHVAETSSHELVTSIDGEVWDMTLLMDMTADELRALAESEGVELPKGRLTKEKLISLIVKKP